MPATQAKAINLESSPVTCSHDLKTRGPEDNNYKYCHVTSEKEVLPSTDVESFVKLLDSESDNVKLEAASSLLHVIRMNYAPVGKSH